MGPVVIESYRFSIDPFKAKFHYLAFAALSYDGRFSMELTTITIIPGDPALTKTYYIDIATPRGVQ